jgi:hypothetical protein
LCREADGQVRARAPRAGRAPRDWIEAELGGAHMGDARLTARLLEMTGPVAAVQQRARKTQMVVMADREADIHEVFAAQANTAHGAQLLIRAERSRNRQVVSAEHTHASLWRTLEQQALLGTREILIPPSDKRAARQATLEVRSAKVSLKPPKRSAHLARVAVWGVLAQEVAPPRRRSKDSNGCCSPAWRSMARRTPSSA